MRTTRGSSTLSARLPLSLFALAFIARFDQMKFQCSFRFLHRNADSALPPFFAHFLRLKHHPLDLRGVQNGKEKQEEEHETKEIDTAKESDVRGREEAAAAEGQVSNSRRLFQAPYGPPQPLHRSRSNVVHPSNVAWHSRQGGGTVRGSVERHRFLIPIAGETFRAAAS